MRQHRYRSAAVVAIGLALGALVVRGAFSPPAAAESKPKDVRLHGYLEFRKAGAFIVDAQRVSTDSKTHFKGSGKVKNVASVPLGWEMQIKGTRQLDGIVLARDIVARPNGTEFMEDDVIK